jgi:leader peptidase (prepilin peptidase)/N-methyltransferase
MPAILFLLPLAGLVWSERPVGVSLILYANLYALALYDHFTMRLPNMLTATLLVVGLMQAYVLAPSLTPYAVGVAAGFLSLFLLGLGYEALRGRQGLGMGDAKFLGAAGAWVGWLGLPPILLVASLAGLGGFLVKAIAKGRHNSSAEIAFGPYLCFGLWLTWLYFSRFGV